MPLLCNSIQFHVIDSPIITDVIKIQAPFTDFNSTTASTTETKPPHTQHPRRKMPWALCHCHSLSWVNLSILALLQQIIWFCFAALGSYM